MIFESPAAGRTEQLRGLWKEAFADTDAFLDGFFAYGFSPDRCRCIVKDDQVLSALYWFDGRVGEQRFAYLYAVATDTAFRGKGLCRALMEDTHRHLQDTGYAGTALVPGNKELFSLYEKLGYRSFCPIETVTVAAGTQPADLTPISPDSYYLRRQCRLGSNAIIQDRTVTDFFMILSDKFIS